MDRELLEGLRAFLCNERDEASAQMDKHSTDNALWKYWSGRKHTAERVIAQVDFLIADNS